MTLLDESRQRRVVKLADLKQEIAGASEAAEAAAPAPAAAAAPDADAEAEAGGGEPKRRRRRRGPRRAQPGGTE